MRHATSGGDGLAARIGRRALLGGALGAAGAFSAARLGLSGLAHAQSAAGRDTTQRFVFVYIGGGWDQLLFLDPRDPAVLTPSRFDSEGIDIHYDQFDTDGFHPGVTTAGALTFGPAAEKPGDAPKFKLSTHHDRIAIVRGVNMNTLSHEAGYRYFLTARFPNGATARGTNVSTEIAAQMGSTLPVPVVALATESYNDRQPGRYSALPAQSVADLMVVLERSAGFRESDRVEAALDQMYRQTSQPCAVDVRDRRGFFTQVREAQRGAQDVLAAHLGVRVQYESDPSTGADAATLERVRQRNARIRAQYELGGADSGNRSTAAFASVVIQEQIAQCVTIRLYGGGDSHTGTDLMHGRGLNSATRAIACLIDDLAGSPAPASMGGSWLDHTTVVVFSEFARTPRSRDDGRNGRDHHLFTSVMLAGGKIRGNQVVGESGPALTGALYNFNERRVARPNESGVENIRPEHLAATLLASAGLDPGITRVSPLSVLLP